MTVQLCDTSRNQLGRWFFVALNDANFIRRPCLAALSDWRLSAAIVTTRSLIRRTLNKQDTTDPENQKAQP
jgi:hypothetical protein